MRSPQDHMIVFCVRQRSNVTETSPGYNQAKPQTDGAVFVVHRQPIALDRFTVHDVRPPETEGELTAVTCFFLDGYCFNLSLS